MKALSLALRLPQVLGPIFRKELRVSSRRRRNYLLRFAYLMLLTAVVVVVWGSEVSWEGTGAYARTKMSEAGKSIVSTIIWFQFITIQLVAIVMLSTSISDEIYHRTLAVLVTTPVTSRQIVVGKLLSRLWQLIILLAISVPLLAIVRVFGGVPWDFVISGVCITLATAIFLGSISMYYSIYHRQAYSAILRTLFIAFVVFALIPALTGLWLFDTGIFIFLHTNPVVALQYSTEVMFDPSAGGWVPGTWFSWVLNCLILLGAAAVILRTCARVVGQVAIGQATGRAGEFPTRTRRAWGPTARRAAARYKRQTTAAIRRVTGSPIIWKELRTPLLRRKGHATLAVVVTILAHLAVYGMWSGGDFVGSSAVHTGYMVVILSLAAICTAVLAGTAIGAEKESRCWPLLLSTTLSDAHIVIGKGIGVFRRCFPVWALLFLHISLFALMGYVHPAMFLHLPMVVGWVVVFLTGAGLYFGVRFKRTTTAVVATFALALFAWVVVPALADEIIPPSRHQEAFDSASPLYQMVVLAEGSCGRSNARRAFARLSYDWPAETFGATTRAMAIITVVYCFVGGAFMRQAAKRLRKNVF